MQIPSRSDFPISPSNFPIKSAIYPCDSYQTHDFVMVDSGKVDGNINSAFAELGEHFPALGAAWVIGRYSVYDYGWCDQWTIKIYPLLKEISRTWLVENPEYNGKNYGFEKRHPSFTSSFALGNFPTSVKLKVTKGKTVSVTWLEKHQGESINGLGNNVSIWEKQYRTFTAFEDDIFVELDTTRWLLNSCVVSEGGQIVDSTGLVLYSNWDSTLGKIKTKLNIPQIQVLTAVDFDYRVDYQARSTIQVGGYYSYGAGNVFDSVRSVSGNYHTSSLGAFVSSYKNPLFQFVPDSYCFAWIQLANNNFENNSISTGLPDSILDIICYEDSVSLNSPYYDRPFQKYYQENGYFSTYRDYNISFPVGDFSVSSVGSVTSQSPRETFGYDSSNKIQPSIAKLRTYPIGFSHNVDHLTGVPIPLFEQYSKNYIASVSFFAMASLDGTIYEKIGTGKVSPNILNEAGQPYKLTDSTRYCWYKHGHIDGHIIPPYEDNNNPENRVVTQAGLADNQINYFQFKSPHDDELFASQRVVYAYQNISRKYTATLTNTGQLRHEESPNWYKYNATATTSTHLVTHIKYQEIDTTNLDNDPVISVINIVSRNEVLLQGSMSVTDDVCMQWYDPGWHRNNVNNPPPYQDYVESKAGSDTYLITLKRNLRLFPRQPKILKEIKWTNNTRTYHEASPSVIKEFIDAFPDDQDGITETIFYSFTKEAKPFVIESGKYYVLSKTSDGIIPAVRLPSSGKVIIGFLGNIDFEIKLFRNTFSALDSNNKAFLFYKEDGYWNSHEVNTTMAESPTTMAIAAALGVAQYSKNPLSPGQERRWNLGAMIHAIAVSQGLNFNANGEIMAPDNSVEYDDGQSVYNRYGTNQAGIAWNNKDAKGKSYGESVPFIGYLYDVLTPKVKTNEFTGEASDLDTGGMVGCPNLPALIEAFCRDVFKALGGDESVGVVPSADGLGYGVYNGLADMISESLYMSSHNSALGMKNFINTQKSVGMLQEVMRGQGLSIEDKEFVVWINGTPVKGIYPGLSGSSPSQLDFILLLLVQLAHILPTAMSAPLPPKSQNSQDNSGA